MKKIIEEAKEKLKEIVFKKESLECFSKNEYNKEKIRLKEKIKEKIKSAIIWGSLPFFIYPIINYLVNDFSITWLWLSFAYSGVDFCIFFVCLIKLYLLNRRKNLNKVLENNKIKKYKETNLSFKELNEFAYVLNKIKSGLNEGEIIELIKIVEIETGEKLGNAYNLFYLINNYESIVNKAKKEENNNLIYREEILKSKLNDRELIEIIKIIEMETGKKIENIIQKAKNNENKNIELKEVFLSLSNINKENQLMENSKIKEIVKI